MVLSYDLHMGLRKIMKPSITIMVCKLRSETNIKHASLPLNCNRLVHIHRLLSSSHRTGLAYENWCLFWLQFHKLYSVFLVCSIMFQLWMLQFNGHSCDNSTSTRYHSILVRVKLFHSDKNITNYVCQIHFFNMPKEMRDSTEQLDE
jgi:hypothetical protein